MYAYEKFAARPTLDIDFLGNNIGNEGSSIIAAFREICSVPYEEDGVIFDTEHITAQNITEFKDYHGIRLSIPVKMDTIAQVLTMDIGFGDVVTPSPIDLDYPVLLEHLPSANILAYSLETVIAEKMHAIVDLADQSSRMKDTFENRHTPYNENTMFFRKEFGSNQQMQVRWTAFMRKITSTDKLSFTEVIAFLQQRLLPFWENMKDE